MASQNSHNSPEFNNDTGLSRPQLHTPNSTRQQPPVLTHLNNYVKCVNNSNMNRCAIVSSFLFIKIFYFIQHRPAKVFYPSL